MNIVDLMSNTAWFLAEGYPWAVWTSQQNRYNDYHYYFSGSVFGEFSAPQDPESPLMYPLKINIYRAVCETLSSSLWGAYEEELIQFRADPKTRGGKVSDAGRTNAERVQRLINDIWLDNGRDTLLASASLSQVKYGGVYLRCLWDAPGGRIKIDALPADMCFPVWSPVDVDHLLALVMAYKMSIKAATEAFGLRPDPAAEDDVLVIEEWTEYKHKIWVDGINTMNTENPYGFIPYEYIPTRRDLETYYGVPPGECIMGLQDEVNKRLADIGDYLNYSAHPIRWVRDYRGDPDKDLPVGPDVLWNLGRSTSAQIQPKVGTLAPNPIPGGTFEYMDKLMGLMQDVVHIPPVALGKDEGSQRSALTLIVRMWPLIQSIKSSRIYWQSGLQRLNDKMLRIIATYGEGVSEDLIGHRSFAEWSPIQPRDKQALIDQTIALTEAYLKSPESAMKDLDVLEPEKELKLIRSWMDEMSKRNIVVQKGVPGKKAQPSV